MVSAGVGSGNTSMGTSIVGAGVLLIPMPEIVIVGRDICIVACSSTGGVSMMVFSISGRLGL